MGEERENARHDQEETYEKIEGNRENLLGLKGKTAKDRRQAVKEKSNSQTTVDAVPTANHLSKKKKREKEKIERCRIRMRKGGGLS